VPCPPNPRASADFSISLAPSRRPKIAVAADPAVLDIIREFDMIRIARQLLAALALLPVLAWAGPVDLNTADAATLARELKGIGPARAEAIVAWREAHGPFKSPEDLVKVQGIGERVLEDNRTLLTVSKPKEAE
jgi:competence protein ComEA